jgi:uncharacterized protein YutE (UPF0331/DUF86 family)
MKKFEINKTTITDRIEIIQKSLKKLEQLRGLTPGKFALDDNFAIAEHYLRYALEATFDICAHILSREPGEKISTYAGMAQEMGRRGFLPVDFAKGNFTNMAKYRNRMTHFYLEITPKELHKIIASFFIKEELKVSNTIANFQLNLNSNRIRLLF